MQFRIACLAAILLSPITQAVSVYGYQFQTVGEFFEQHPGARVHGTPFYRPESILDEANTFGAIYGTPLATGATPQESAFSVIAQIGPLLGDDWGTLEIQKQHNGEELLSVTVNPANDVPGFYTLRFNQVFEGLPVLRSGLGFLVRNEPGFPVVLSGIEIKNLPGFHVGAIDSANAIVTKSMLEKVTRLIELGTDRGLKSVMKVGHQEIQVSEEELVIFAGVNGKTADPQVAVQFVATRGSIQTVPDYKKYLIVASRDTGEILVAENQILDVDVTGSVRGRATTGIATLECEPEVATGMPYAQVSVDGGNSVFADLNGNFTIPHAGSSQVTVRSSLRGRWFRVFDQAATNTTPEITSLTTPPGPANFLHNPDTDIEFATANVNGYLEANVIRDFTLLHQPTFPVIGNQSSFKVNTNLNDTCNAFYDGSSINFFRAGGGCFNTSMSDIVYHEYGHHLVDVTDNGQQAFGEGSGDVMGVLIQDEPVLAYGFAANCNAGLRTANNTMQYPCTSSIHTCGQLLSGAIWDTRHQLAITEPSDYRAINSTLFLGMLMTRGQMRPFDGTIDPFITVLYLMLDDDDANINNGTPHYNEIAAGFGLHNLDAPTLTLLEFEFPTGRPELIPHDGGVAFNVQVVASSQDPVPGSGRMYVDTGNGFQLYQMNQISLNLYQANFPSSSCGQAIRYYFIAEAEGGIDQFEPQGAPVTNYSALAATSSRTGFTDNFETHTGWFEIGNASDGFWERGVPAGSGTRGDPSVDGDGSGQCYLTGNFFGNSDVDDGYTWLASPLMGAIGDPDEIAILTYMRWYSNSEGDNPESDVFVVELSNNSGATFTVLETVGPSGPEVNGGWVQKSFRISDFLTPTSQMRLVFKASDEGDGSIVEAAIDAVSIKFLKCQSAPPVTAEETKLVDGVGAGGSWSNIDESDDLYRDINPQPTLNPKKQIVDLIVQTTSPVAAPPNLRFRVEAKILGGPAGSVMQKIRLYNYDIDKFETIDVRPATVADSIVEITVTGNPQRFLHLNEMTARIIWTSPTFVGTPFPWSIELDQVVWLID